MSESRPPKKSTSVRLSVEAKRLLDLIATDLGITQAAALEISIRKMAEARQLRRNSDSLVL